MSLAILEFKFGLVGSTGNSTGHMSLAILEFKLTRAESTYKVTEYESRHIGI